MTTQDSIVFQIERRTPIKLESLTLGMIALEAEYQRHLKAEHPKAQDHEADLLVRKISEGSIVIELVGAMLPVLQGMDTIPIFKGFVKMLDDKLTTLSAPRGRLKDASINEITNFMRIAETVADDREGKASVFVLEYESESDERKVTAKVTCSSTDSKNIVANATEQIKEISGLDGSSVHNSVLMRLYQTNIGKPSTEKASGEKGIIEHIGLEPKRLIYASELAGQEIKNSWNAEGVNPYELCFVVDVDIQMVKGKPRAYRVMNVHDIFPLDENND